MLVAGEISSCSSAPSTTRPEGTPPTTSCRPRPTFVPTSGTLWKATRASPEKGAAAWAEIVSRVYAGDNHRVTPFPMTQPPVRPRSTRTRRHPGRPMRMRRPTGRTAANDIRLTDNDCGHTGHVGTCASRQRRALARSREQLAAATGLQRAATPRRSARPAGSARFLHPVALTGHSRPASRDGIS